MKLVFWNTNKNSNPSMIANIASTEKPDCFLLAEAGFAVQNTATNMSYNIAPTILDKAPKIYLLYDSKKIVNISVIQEYKKRLYAYVVENRNDRYLIIGVHFGSKINFDKENQLCEAIDYMDQIKAIEQKSSCKNSIIIGDFNMNPFDPGMIAGNAFNSIISEEIAKKGSRKIQRKEYEYFYNPSWKFFTQNENDYGTFYLSNPDHSSFHWNVYDQILVRPTILRDYRVTVNVIKNKKYFSHTEEAASDHSPIYMQIERR